jgi:hypothetical protein
MTYNQFTVLLIHCFLLEKLCAPLTRYPEGYWGIRTNLVFDDSVPDISCKLTHSMSICVIFLVTSCPGTLRQGMQFVLDPLKSSRIGLVWAPIING